MPTPLLSIGMIVKNESRCLEKCLKALEPIRNAVPCELVIADTGSTDNTKEIAKKYADTVFDFTWVNDFSKARNAVIECCHGKWCLTIDADEYFAGNIDDLVALVTDSKYDEYDFVNIVIRNFTDPQMKSAYSDFFVSRIFRLGKGYKYQKPIHEFIPIKDTSKSIILSSIIFNHDGYAVIDNDHLKNKTKRNLELLEKEYENKPNDTRIILEILDSVYLFKNESIHYAKIAIEHLKNLPVNSKAKNIFGPVISRKCIQYATKNNLPETNEWIKFVFENFSESFFVSLDINYICTEYFYKNNNYSAALKHSENYLESFEKYENLDKNNLPRELFASSLITSHKFHKDNISLILSELLFNSNDNELAIFYLKSIEIKNSNADNFEKWFSVIENHIKSPEVSSLAQNVLIELFNLKDSGTETEITQYNFAVVHIKKLLSNDCNPDILNFFCCLPDSLGISSRILTATEKDIAKKEISQLLSAENFLPSAFNKLIKLNVPIPDSFMKLSPEHLNELLSGLKLNDAKSAQTILDITSPESITTLTHCSFAFNLISVSWLEKVQLPIDMFEYFEDRFYSVSRLFLTNLYSPEILECDDTFCTLQQLHRFAIFYIMASDSEIAEEKNMLFLKALEIEPKMKKLINYSMNRQNN